MVCPKDLRTTGLAPSTLESGRQDKSQMCFLVCRPIRPSIDRKGAYGRNLGASSTLLSLPLNYEAVFIVRVAKKSSMIRDHVEYDETPKRPKRVFQP